MNAITNTIKAQPLAVAAIVVGSYLAAGRAKNIRDGQGCPKCEWTQLAASIALVGIAAFVLFKEAKNGVV